MRFLEDRTDELERSLRLIGPAKARDRARFKQLLLEGVRDELADVLAEMRTTRGSVANGASEGRLTGDSILRESMGDKGGSARVGMSKGKARSDRLAINDVSMLDEQGFLEEIVTKLDEAREGRDNIYDFIFRLLIRQEINTARTKLLFLVQRYEIDLSLFDQLDQMEEGINNTFISTEELNLRWKIFEERVKTEIERLRSD